MNVDFDTVRIAVQFENGSDDPNAYPHYDHCGFVPGPLSVEEAHRLSQIHLHSESVQCRQKQAALSTLEAAGVVHRTSQSGVRS